MVGRVISGKFNANARLSSDVACIVYEADYNPEKEEGCYRRTSGFEKQLKDEASNDMSAK